MKFKAAYWVPSTGAEATGGTFFSAEGMRNYDLILIYSTGGMVINTQDTNYSTRGIIINNQDTNYSIRGIVINTEDTNYSIRWE